MEGQTGRDFKASEASGMAHTTWVGQDDVPLVTPD